MAKWWRGEGGQGRHRRGKGRAGETQEGEGRGRGDPLISRHPANGEMGEGKKGVGVSRRF